MTFFDESPLSASNETSRIDRRGVLGTLGLAGLGVLASSATAGAATRAKISTSTPRVSVITSSRPSVQPNPQPAVARPDLPEEWVAMNGAYVNDYYKYLSSLQMKRVSPKQVIETHAKSKAGVWNTLPPKSWWKRMGYTLRVVDRIALELNVNEVEVISAYRAPAYNAHCAGARAGSWHQANVAADVKFPVRASKVTATARELRDLGLFRGGVGGYWNFTHIDARGVNINW
jgi:hypothetical protein